MMYVCIPATFIIIIAIEAWFIWWFTVFPTWYFLSFTFVFQLRWYTLPSYWFTWWWPFNFFFRVWIWWLWIPSIWSASRTNVLDKNKSTPMKRVIEHHDTWSPKIINKFVTFFHKLLIPMEILKRNKAYLSLTVSNRLAVHNLPLLMTMCTIIISV